MAHKCSLFANIYPALLQLQPHLGQRIWETSHLSLLFLTLFNFFLLSVPMHNYNIISYWLSYLHYLDGHA